MNKTQITHILGSKPILRHICGNGAEMLRYKACIDDTYIVLRTAYEADGYTLYCEQTSYPILSATYVKGDEYAVLFYFKWEKQLHITLSKKGAKNFLDQTGVENYEMLYPVTLTQPKTEQQGMCEIFRLADGSFLIFDSGNVGAHHTIYQTLCDLNGSKENIRVRAWFLTHTHRDHYGGFIGIAHDYADSITIDAVMYAPVNRDVIATIASYKTPWMALTIFSTTSCHL